MTKFKVGDKVKIRPDVAGKWANVEFTVQKLLTVNVQIAYDGGALRANPNMLIPADQAGTIVGPTPVFEPPLTIGTVVRYGGVLYVVMACNPSGRYRIVKLGGNHGHYFTNVSRHVLIVVDVADILKDNI